MCPNARKGFWIQFTARRAAAERAGGPLGPWEGDFDKRRTLLGGGGCSLFSTGGWRYCPLREKLCSAG